MTLNYHFFLVRDDIDHDSAYRDYVCGLYESRTQPVQIVRE